MRRTNPPPRFEAVLAYVLAGITSAMWVACVVPAGALLDLTQAEEVATPMYRERILLVPALFLLTLLPVGFTLARRRSGLTALLASTDTFVALYAGLAILGVHGPLGLAGTVCMALFLLVAGLSALETWRNLARGDADEPLRGVAGMRLALCLLVLVVPSRFLLEAGVERASWLGPFLLIAVSAAGARMAHTDRAYRRTGAIVQLAVAVHVAVTVRYTLLHATPLYLDLGPAGWIALGLAGALVLVAATQLFALLRSPRCSPP